MGQQLKDVISRLPLTRTSSGLLPATLPGNQLIRAEDHYKLDLYGHGQLTELGAAAGMKKLKAVFPQLTKEFLQVMIERAAEHHFSDERLMDAINRVIDTCVYPVPAMADIISQNRNVKLYTYDQVLKIHDLTQSAFRTYKAVRIEGRIKPMWAHVDDVEQYGLELFNKNS